MNEVEVGWFQIGSGKLGEDSVRFGKRYECLGAASTTSFAI